MHLFAIDSSGSMVRFEKEIQHYQTLIGKNPNILIVGFDYQRVNFWPTPFMNGSSFDALKKFVKERNFESVTVVTDSEIDKTDLPESDWHMMVMGI